MSSTKPTVASQLPSDARRVSVIGAGLSGTLTAALLLDQGFHVYMFEKREDIPTDHENINSEFGHATSSTKRSINLALSHRGIVALERLGLVSSVMKYAIPMPQRVIHSVDGSINLQPYGRPGQALFSVSRNGLNESIKNYLRQSDKPIEMFFGYSLLNVDKDGKCTFVLPDGSEFNDQYDMVIGADGAGSVVRECLLKQGRIDFMRKFVTHGYKELTIPPVIDPVTHAPRFAMEPSNGLHIWPRGEFMLIALPNPDYTYTATLFAPWEGKYGFDQIDLKDTVAIRTYLETYFPDAVKLMPNCVEDFQRNPVGSLGTLKVNPWNFGRVCLIGDAAHAVVPFFGQGMNAAFQDGCMLTDIISREIKKSSVQAVDLDKCLAEFSEVRHPATNALSDFCLEHYHDMAKNTSSASYLFYKKIESLIYYMFPNSFLPFYSMVAFTTMPYHEAVARAERQDKWISRFFLGTVGLGFGALSWFMRDDLKRLIKFN